MSDGRGASARPQARSDHLVGRYLAEARAVNRQAQSYGGSTGRPGGVYGSEAPTQRQVVASARGEETREKQAIFNVDDGPRAVAREAYPGGRSVVAEARGFKKPPATS